MKSIKTMSEELLSEKFLNLIDNDERKEEYADVIWKMLNKAYEGIGGLKGSGFKSKEDMIKNINFWKIFKRNGVPIAVAMYRDKGGRKRVAVASDGTAEGKQAVYDVYKNDFDRAYFEVSDASLGAILKNVGEEKALKYAKNIDEVKKISPKHDILEPDFSDPDISAIVKKYPKIAKFYYRREIKGKIKHKIMLGTKGKIITKD